MQIDKKKLRKTLRDVAGAVLMGLLMSAGAWFVILHEWLF